MPLIKKHSERFDFIAVWIGRIGFICRGFVWACIGGVAASAAFTLNKPQNATGAMEVVANNVGGVVVLIFLAIGLLAYTSWRWFEGFYGLSVNPHARTFSKVINGYITPFASGLAYFFYAIVTLIYVSNGLSSESTNSNNCSIICKIASNVAGSIFLTLAGIILFGVAIAWIVELIRNHGRPLSPLDQQKLRKLPQIMIFSIYIIGAIGLFGRAILFGLLSALIIRVAWDHRVKNAGFGYALGSLQVSTGGKVLLIIVGVMLVFFGVFSLIQARYKEFLPYKPHILSNNLQSKIEHFKEEISHKFSPKLNSKSQSGASIPPV